jgi:hypothetical protein
LHVASKYTGPKNLNTAEAERRYSDGIMRKQYTAAFKAKVVQEPLSARCMFAKQAVDYSVLTARSYAIAVKSDS